MHGGAVTASTAIRGIPVAHVSLYRKYRPRSFAEVVGQDHVTTTLARAVDEQRWHHAYLFTGPRGTGKTSTARLLAMALNATGGPTSTPAADDPMCAAIAAGAAPDVIEIDAASHGGVDDVRDLRERVNFAPAQARVKVYIVDECHMLSTAGWNAFLKTVEEPPGHVVFVFATTEPHKVLPTILSRTQRFDFRRIPAPVLEQHLRWIGEQEGLTFEDGALEPIIRAGDGSARDTLSVLDQVVAFTGTHVTAAAVADVLGTVPAALLDELAAAIAAGDVAAVLGLVQRVADQGQDLRQFAQDGIEHLRSLLLLRTVPDGGLVEGTPERLAQLRAQADAIGTVTLLRAVELLNECQAKMRRGNTRLPLEVALAKATLPEASGDPAALAARIDQLEARLQQGEPLLPRPDPEPLQPSPAPEPSRPAEPQPAPEPSRPAEPEPEPAPEPPLPAEPPSPREPVVPDEPDPRPREPDLPPEPPVPAATPATADALAAARDAWPTVLETIGRSSKRLQAVLAEGQPHAVSGDTLVLRFPYDFHAVQASTDQARQTVAELVQQVVGTRYQIACVVGGEDLPHAVDDEAADVLDSEAAEAAGEVPEPEVAHDTAVQALTDGLGAVVLDDTHHR